MSGEYAAPPFAATDAVYVSLTNIEDLQAGDWVWSRDQSAEDDDASLHQVARVFKKVSDHLRIVQIRDADGNVETIQTTDEHPFWVAGRGWMAAKDLAAGDKLNEADDSDDATVVSSVREEHPEGVAVYNFEVQGDHTYFVEDGFGPRTAVWVHNTCSERIAELRDAGYQEHHIISNKNARTRDHELLELAEFDLQSRRNKIFLPESADLHPTRSIHSGKHLGEHSDRLADEMDAIVKYGMSNDWSKAQYNDALRSLIATERAELKAGNIALNKNKRPWAQ